MTNKEHEIFMRKLFDEKLDEAFDRGCVNMVQKLVEYFTKYGITLNVNNWMNDYSQGYDTAKEDITEFALQMKDKYKVGFPTTNNYADGYRTAAIDILNHIEGM